MSQILLLNARRKTRRRAKTTRKRRAKKPARRRAVARKKTTVRRTAIKKGAIMAKQRRRTTTTKTTKRRRRNPSRARRAGTAVSRRASSSLAGLNFKGAIKNVPMNAIGMFAAKWAAKKFGSAATETDPSTWDYASYLKGAAGAAIAGFLANMLRRGSGQKVLEGGLSLMAYKLIQNELIPNSPFWTGQLGAVRVPGTIEENAEGEPYILGEDNEWYPLEGEDDYRMMPGSYSEYSDALVPPGPLGEALVPPGPLGATDLDSLYQRAFIDR